MNRSVLLAALACLIELSSAQVNTIIKSDKQGEWLDSGQEVTQNTYPYPLKFPVQGAIWIWAQDWNPAPDFDFQVINEEFQLYCNSPINVYATADNQLKVYINDELIFEGNNWKKIGTAEIQVDDLNICGKNTLRIEAKNWDGNPKLNPAGVIYGITQDQSCRSSNPNPCCPDNGNFNTEIGTCQCDGGYIYANGEPAVCEPCLNNDWTVEAQNTQKGTPLDTCQCKAATDAFIPQLGSCCPENTGFVSEQTECQPKPGYIWDNSQPKTPGPKSAKRCQADEWTTQSSADFNTCRCKGDTAKEVFVPQLGSCCPQNTGFVQGNTECQPNSGYIWDVSDPKVVIPCQEDEWTTTSSTNSETCQCKNNTPGQFFAPQLGSCCPENTEYVKGEKECQPKAGYIWNINDPRVVVSCSDDEWTLSSAVDSETCQCKNNGLNEEFVPQLGSCCPENTGFVQGKTRCQPNYGYIWDNSEPKTAGPRFATRCQDNEWTSPSSTDSNTCLCKNLSPKERFVPQLGSCCPENTGYVQGKTECEPNPGYIWDNSEPKNPGPRVATRCEDNEWTTQNSADSMRCQCKDITDKFIEQLGFCCPQNTGYVSGETECKPQPGFIWVNSGPTILRLGPSPLSTISCQDDKWTTSSSTDENTCLCKADTHNFIQQLGSCCPEFSGFDGVDACQCDEGYLWNADKTACILNCPINDYTTGLLDGMGGCECEDPEKQRWFLDAFSCVKLPKDLYPKSESSEKSSKKSSKKSTKESSKKSSKDKSKSSQSQEAPKAQAQVQVKSEEKSKAKSQEKSEAESKKGGILNKLLKLRREDSQSISKKSKKQ